MRKIHLSRCYLPTTCPLPGDYSKLATHGVVTQELALVTRCSGHDTFWPLRRMMWSLSVSCAQRSLIWTFCSFPRCGHGSVFVTRSYRAWRTVASAPARGAPAIGRSRRSVSRARQQRQSSVVRHQGEVVPVVNVCAPATQMVGQKCRSDPKADAPAGRDRKHGLSRPATQPTGCFCCQTLRDWSMALLFWQ